LIEGYVGGVGFGARLLYDDLGAGVDPLGPDNELIFVAGPLAGTGAQSFGRWKVFFKSPLSGGYFKSSGGGYFASALKFSGYDAVILRGRADRPVYLLVQEGRVEFREAGHLTGMDCERTQETIRRELSSEKVRMVCIGPAAEQGVRYAGIFSDRRAAGRGGGGTVMASKNLKAMAVRGTHRVCLSRPEAFKSAVRAQVQRYRSDPHYKVFSSRGTQNPEFTNLLGIFPTRNFREGVLPHWERIESSEFEKLRQKKTQCYNCMIHCGSITRVAEGPYEGAWSEGPEYETIWGFTGSIGSADIGLTVAADRLCDLLGLDTISTGVAIGFAYELFERGILSKSDTGGLELRYGDGGPVLSLIRKIANREDIGAILAQGVREAGRRIGKKAEVFAMEVKGLELPGYDPRGAKAHGLNLMTTALGADHCSGFAHQEIFGALYKGEKVDRFSIEQKGEMTKWNQDLRTTQHLGILCNFASRYVEPKHMAEFLAAATGIDLFADPEYLLRVGERVVNLERMFNVREGFGRRDDRFPSRLLEEPLPAGPAAGQVFEAEALLTQYYEARGWDPETGHPTPRKLRQLGLDFCLSEKG
jgi:aldehyde:ferredoxin oxidoreductase